MTSNDHKLITEVQKKAEDNVTKSNSNRQRGTECNWIRNKNSRASTLINIIKSLKSLLLSLNSRVVFVYSSVDESTV